MQNDYLLGIFIFFISEGLPACMFVYCVHSWCPQRSEVATVSPGARVKGSACCMWLLGTVPLPCSSATATGTFRC